MFKFEDVVIFWINCSSNQRRFNHMEKLLERYFPLNERHHVEAVMYKPKYQGVTMAHTVALMKGLAIKKPFIILEDDVDIDGMNLDVGLLEENVRKGDADAVYLGISGWAKPKNRGIISSLMKNGEKVVRIKDKIFFYKGAKGEYVDDYFFKIKEMYGAHAILYLKEDYVVRTLKYCIFAVGQNKPHDIYLPRLLRKSSVYGLCNSWFYQLAKIGGQEKATKIYLSGVRKINYRENYEDVIEQGAA